MIYVENFISTLAKTASFEVKGSEVSLTVFLSTQLPTLYSCLICPCMEYASHVFGFPLIQLFISSSPLFQLTVLYLFLITQILYFLLFSTLIFMPSALLILLTAWLTAQYFLPPLTTILYTSLMQELISIPKQSFLSLVNSGTPCLLLYFHLPSICTHARWSQDIPYFWLVDIVVWGSASQKYAQMFLNEAQDTRHKSK